MSSRYYFVQCEAFFQDSKGHTHVVLRRYDQPGPDISDGAVLLPRLKLRPHEQPRIYSALPASCIHNGALLIASGAHHCAIMSPATAEAWCSMLPVGHLDYRPKCIRTFLGFQLIFIEIQHQNLKCSEFRLLHNVSFYIS